MKVWRDKSGKWITAKEFTKRFSEGVQEVSPIQQARLTLWGQYIILIGITLGLFINGFAHIWWLFIILCGSMFVALMSTLGSYQKYTMLKKMFSPEEEEELDQITNSQEIDVEGKLMIPPTPQTSSNVTAVTPDGSNSIMKGGKESEVKI